MPTGTSINDIISAMSDLSIGIFYIYNNNIVGVPLESQASLTIFKLGKTFQCFCQNIWNDEFYIATYVDNNTVGEWKQLASKNYVDEKIISS